jgi:hypothetical protein
MRLFPAIAFLSAIVALAASQGAAIAQSGFDRPGGDYSYVPVRSGDPAACVAACERDQQCRAWSFSYPATVGDAAICWLKNEVTPRVPNPCCVSGVRGAGVVEPRFGVIEFSIDRYGGDYRNFQMPSAVPVTACQAACEAEGRCRAWTYLRPGYIGSTARCFLKDRIKPPRRKPCCISGVAR